MRWEINFLAEAPSTNDAVRGCGEGAVAVAARQTAGRGQRGNTWYSVEGESLSFSAVLEPVFIEAAMQFLLSEAVALAVSDALAEYGIEAAVKWPNDIYIGDRKVAGILIENDVRGSVLGRSVVGIGLNVNQLSFPPELLNPVSMRQATGTEYNLNEVLGGILAALDVRYGAFKMGVGPEEDYARRLYGAGERRRFALPDGSRFDGIIRGARRGGELIVELPDGSQREFLFKEVEFV